jgi:hypothetical protein
LVSQTGLGFSRGCTSFQLKVNIVTIDDIDDIAYAEGDLSNEAKKELGSMQGCDQRKAAPKAKPKAKKA